MVSSKPRFYRQDCACGAGTSPAAFEVGFDGLCRLALARAQNHQRQSQKRRTRASAPHERSSYALHIEQAQSRQPVFLQQPFVQILLLQLIDLRRRHLAAVGASSRSASARTVTISSSGVAASSAANNFSSSTVSRRSRSSRRGEVFGFHLGSQFAQRASRLPRQRQRLKFRAAPAVSR